MQIPVCGGQPISGREASVSALCTVVLYLLLFYLRYAITHLGALGRKFGEGTLVVRILKTTYVGKAAYTVANAITISHKNCKPMHYILVALNAAVDGYSSRNWAVCLRCQVVELENWRFNKLSDHRSFGNLYTETKIEDLGKRKCDPPTCSM